VNGRGVLAKLFFPVIIIALLVWLAASSLGTGTDDTKRKYLFSQMLQQVRQQPRSIRSVTFHPSTQEVEFRYADGTKAKAAYPVDQSAYELQQLLESRHVLFDAKRTSSSPWWSLLTSLLPFVLLFGFWIFLMQQVQRRKWGQTRSGSDPTSSSD
jgi:cell division protease FtsH